MENGKLKIENGKWKMENGKWKMENGKWKMENGKLKIFTPAIKPDIKPQVDEIDRSVSTPWIYTQIKDTDRHRFIQIILKYLCLSVFICVHLWLKNFLPKR